MVKELLAKPKVKAYSMLILVENRQDQVTRENYINVCLLNPRYTLPPKGAKPWNGGRGIKIPKGKYNCNLTKYNKYFAFIGIRWSQLIDTPVKNEAGCSHEKCLANILWELTFDGWTEEKAVEKSESIEQCIEEADKEIKEGKCVTLPLEKKGDWKIVIPDCVSQQLIDIANRKGK